ncbi:DUF4149 domain-containing protein [Paenibacillus durus]|uniref:TMEM205-like domain-containing protein n=1 Tax=Paenibacillus durus TaxID=44251 RepID=A0A089HTS2_PAEDU|nr:DUF4149 domain-containing protein [Paenibacillus durus]AIQ13768.1 hypothetical protein PDUR_18980 [Paenibacillus durus]
MEKIIHGSIVGLHILAVITWIGSMIYSQFAVMPALKKALGNNKLHAISGLMMKSYAPLTWTSLIIVVLTGIYIVFDKREQFNTLQTGPGAVLLLKLLLVAALIVIFLLQVFLYGPKMKQLIMPSTPKTNENQLEMEKLEQTTGALSWWHLGIGVTIVIFGVILSQLLD